MREMLRIAFRDRLVDRMDHPLIHRLGGCNLFPQLPFKHIVAVDFEFELGGHTTLEEANRSGERPRPVCMVAKDLCTEKEWRLFRGEFGDKPPFPTGTDTVVLAYFASAEIECFQALRWPKPAHVLDLFTEFRCQTNGRKLPCGNGLLGALTYFGCDTCPRSRKTRCGFSLSAADRGPPRNAKPF